MKISALLYVIPIFSFAPAVTAYGDRGPLSLEEVVANSVFCSPPMTIDVSLVRSSKLDPPTGETLRQQAKYEFQRLELDRALLGRPPLNSDEAISKIEEQLRKDYGLKNNAELQQRWRISSNGSFAVEGVSAIGDKELYIQPGSSAQSQLLPKYANFSSKALYIKEGNAAALEDFRLYGRITHPMMPTLSSMAQGTFSPANNGSRNSLSQEGAQALIERMKEQYARSIVATEGSLEGRSVINVKSAVSGISYALDFNDPNLCYERTVEKDGRVISRETYRDFQSQGASGLKYPMRIKIERLTDGRRWLKETIQIQSVTLNEDLPEASLDQWKTPDGWLVIDQKRQQVSRVVDGKLKQVDVREVDVPTGLMKGNVYEAAGILASSETLDAIETLDSSAPAPPLEDDAGARNVPRPLSEDSATTHTIYSTSWFKPYYLLIGFIPFFWGGYLIGKKRRDLRVWAIAACVVIFSGVATVAILKGSWEAGIIALIACALLLATVLTGSRKAPPSH